MLDVGTMTHVPGGPKSLRGVLNLRGHVVPVYDLRIPFELPIDPQPTRAPSVLMVEAAAGQDAHVTGLLVDRVFDVLEFTPEEIQPAPQLGLGKATPYVRGLIRHQDGFLLVLDVDCVFALLESLNATSTVGASDVAPTDPPPSTSPEPWSETDFAPILAFLQHQIGITLEPHRMGLLQARLRSRLQAKCLTSFTQFCERVLKLDPSGPGTQLLIDLSTVNHTAFFREPTHFTRLTEHISVLLRSGSTTPIRIWSAGCSTGQEPYSIAMVIAETIPSLSPQRVEIWASDLSLEVLKTAASAIYNENDVKGVAPARLRRFFLLVEARATVRTGSSRRCATSSSSATSTSATQTGRYRPISISFSAATFRSISPRRSD